MKVLKILLLIIVWPVGLIYLIVWSVKKHKQKKVLENIDFDQDEKLKSLIDLVLKERDDFMKNALLVSLINYFNRAYPQCRNCSFIQPFVKLAKKYETLGVFKNEKLTQSGLGIIQSLYIRPYQIADDCERLINTTKNPETFFSRYYLLIDQLTRVSRLEEFVVVPHKGFKRASYWLAHTKAFKQGYISFLLDRVTKQHSANFLEYLDELDESNKEKLFQLFPKLLQNSIA